MVYQRSLYWLNNGLTASQGSQGGPQKTKLHCHPQFRQRSLLTRLLCLQFLTWTKHHLFGQMRKQTRTVQEELRHQVHPTRNLKPEKCLSQSRGQAYQ